MEYNILKFIFFEDWYLWDVKWLFMRRMQSVFPIVKLGDFIQEENNRIKPADSPDELHKILGVNNIDGIFDAYAQLGKEIKQPYKIVKEGFLAYNPYRVNVGSIGIKTEEHKHDLICPAYVVFSCKKELNPKFLFKLFKTDTFNKLINNSTTGSVRQNLTIDILKSFEIPLPSLSEQSAILSAYNTKMQEAENLEKEMENFDEEFNHFILSELGFKKNKEKQEKQDLHLVNLKDMFCWGFDQLINNQEKSSEKYFITSIDNNPELVISISRGKSPKYQDNTNSIIINQKCNRWNETELKYAKTVNPDWLSSLPENDFTKEGDVIINSTGEGTIGRSSTIIKEYEGLMYDSHILLLRLDQSKVCPNYFSYLFNTQYGQNQVDNIKSAQSTKQTELGINNLKKVKFPLPPLSIQKEIASQLDAMVEAQKEKRSKVVELKQTALQEFEDAIFRL